MAKAERARQAEPLAFISARLTAEERRKLEAVAAASDRTPSAVVRRALRAYIDHLDEIERILKGDRS